MAYENVIEEDQLAWRAAKLYDLVVPQSVVSSLGERQPAEGYGSHGEPTLALELGELAQLKLAAITRHVSQTGSAGPFHDWGSEAREAWLGTEHYRLAVSALPVATVGEQDLFDGLP
jgi:LmbE family N-acetylglucosaminyl deacetylase